MLKALFLNGSLKKSPEPSHTEALMRESMGIFEGAGFETEMVRFVDYPVAFGVDKDMGPGSVWGEADAWPHIFGKVMAANAVVIGSPIWIGNPSSACIQLLERLYAHSSDTNEKGQYIYYNKVGGCVVTGNEDGGKFVSSRILYSLQHIGFTVPPGADSYWVGEAGPGPSYMEAGRANDFTKTTLRLMSWNLIHFARMLAERPIPAEGNTVPPT
jgi:multimeric flavodoxin WrbA